LVREAYRKVTLAVLGGTGSAVGLMVVLWIAGVIHTVPMQ